ncbi:hypothetical protein C8Q80DRAFT_805289 [Daedaleopsis nitida]|nr:hypothetical protein C8Q80DRAFT_805289 [Daedaleopsis nitida]
MLLLDILSSASPVWAQLWLVLSPFPAGRFWKEMPVRASRLRYLDLNISLPPSQEGHPDRLVSLCNNGEALDRLSALPLVYLGLCCGTSVKTWDSDLTLPHRCAQAIPTLKFFALRSVRRLDAFSEDEAPEEVHIIQLRPLRQHDYGPTADSQTGWMVYERWEARLWRIARGQRQGGECRVLPSPTTLSEAGHLPGRRAA